MPNWCENTLRICGKKKDILALFKKIGYQGDISGIEEFVTKTEITMRSWFPMPQTFIDWDTTNRKHTRDDQDYNKEPLYDEKDENGKITKRVYPPLFNSDEEYETYSKGYDDAVKYQQETFGFVGWFDYNCGTLGVKWNAILNEYGVSYFENEFDFICIVFQFDTAWNDPLIWLNSMMGENPNIEFECDSYEGGMGFHCYFHAENGEILSQYTEDWEYPMEEDEEENNSDTDDDVALP